MIPASLKVNFRKSTFLALDVQQWHHVLWPGGIPPTGHIVHHLGYPLGWQLSSS